MGKHRLRKGAGWRLLWESARPNKPHVYESNVLELITKFEQELIDTGVTFTKIRINKAD